MIAVAIFLLPDRGSDSSFGGVIGGLDALDLQKGEEAVPARQQPLCGLGDFTILTVRVLLEAVSHASSDGYRLADKRFPVDPVLHKGIPQSEHATRLGEHPCCEPHRIRATTHVLQTFDGAKDMSPTILPQTLLIRFIRTEHFRTQANGHSEDRREGLLETSAGNPVACSEIRRNPLNTWTEGRLSVSRSRSLGDRSAGTSRNWRSPW